MPRVFFPPQLRDLTGGRSEADCEARSLRELVDALDAAFPGIKARLVSGGKIASGLAFAIDDEVSTLGLLAPLAPASRVHIVTAIRGG